MIERRLAVIEAKTETGLDIGAIQWELIYHIDKRGKVKAAELAELVGITIPSVRVRLLQLMAMGIVAREKTRDRQVWFYLKRRDEKNGARKSAIVQSNPKTKQTARERRGKGAARREADAL
jgi:predicted ArsR family transcriptional regulator